MKKHPVSVTCSICGETVTDNKRECPNCGAELPVDVEQPKPQKTRHPWRSAARRAGLIAAEKGIEKKLKAAKKSLDNEDFPGALKTYQGTRKQASQLKHAGLFAVLFDLLEQSASQLVSQKTARETAPRQTVEAKRRRSPSLLGRLVLVPVFILAGIGLMGIITTGSLFGGKPPPPTLTVEPVTPTITLTAAPTATQGPTPLPDPLPISSANLKQVRELFNWPAGEDIVSLAFSPDGRLIASGDGDGSVKVWRLWTDELLFELEGTHAAFSPDGRWIGTAGSSGVRMYDASNGQLARTFDDTRFYYSVLFSPDSQLIVAGSDNTKFYIWSVNDGAEQKSGGSLFGEIHSLSFAADSRLLAVASKENTYVWNLQKQKIERTVDFPREKPVYYSVAVDTDGEWFAMGHENGQIYIWRMSNGERMARFDDDSRFVHGLQFLYGSNSPEVLVSGDEVNLSFWKMQGYEVTRHPIYVSTPILSLSVAPGNKLVATGGRDGVIHLWGVLP